MYAKLASRNLFTSRSSCDVNSQSLTLEYCYVRLQSICYQCRLSFEVLVVRDVYIFMITCHVPANSKCP